MKNSASISPTMCPTPTRDNVRFFEITSKIYPRSKLVASLLVGDFGVLLKNIKVGIYIYYNPEVFDSPWPFEVSSVKNKKYTGNESCHM